jgi:CheY-like chemotaxis protein
MSEEIFDAKNYTILVVDDEESLRDAIAFDFKRKGYQVLVASNGTEAFTLVQKGNVDVVLSDMRMPGGDGMELLKNIKNSSPHKPVVMFITGFSDVTLEEAYHEGADAVFSKPFDRKSLQSAVVHVLTSNEKRLGTPPGEPATTNIDLHLPEFKTVIDAKLIGFGRGGMFVVFGKEEGKVPVPGASIAFKIEFDQSDSSVSGPGSIDGSGIVRWTCKEKDERKPGYGIEFTYLNDNCRSQVIYYLNSLNTKSFIPSITAAIKDGFLK